MKIKSVYLPDEYFEAGYRLMKRKEAEQLCQTNESSRNLRYCLRRAITNALRNVRTLLTGSTSVI